MDSETLRYIREEFGYTPETPISWAGVCQVFFNRSIRTMQRRKAYQAFLTSGEMTVQTNKKADRSRTAPRSQRKRKNQIDEREHAEITEIARLAVKWASENPDSDSAWAIMQLAADRAKRLGTAAPRLVTKSDAKWVITTPKALFEFLNTEYIDTLDDVFSPESEPQEFASKLLDFASEIARAFHGEAIRVEITVRKDRA